MPNKTTKTNLRPQQFVDAFSRYTESEVIYYGERNLLTFTTYKKRNSAPNDGDRFTVIRPGHEYRPDLVSQEAYGSPNFWWFIMEANGIMDIFDFKGGMNIRLPGRVF